ncbi:ATP-dependent RNA helicase DBP3 [Hibiscus syriacus]|uniref:RNA helicase n=1 Tax=Hibiscus syriacus TaxID=106335 RepID=A0A6A3C4Q5_HIBSY|nr:DEAD-box ATP-dependent RNA helicase 5-like [Hibiscus syriacus]KAE8724175.1 ATP-dependent RNA helicase DBP3 [Hibiscus syriacus]
MTPSTEPSSQQNTGNQAVRTKKKNKKNKSSESEHQVEENVKQSYQENEEIEPKDSKKDKKRKKKERENNGGGEFEEVNHDESGEESKKRKKKKGKNNKKQMKEEENGEFNESRSGKEDTIQFDGKEKVVVSGKNAEDAKYSPLKSFSNSNLPKNVLECCKDFSSPSPIQAHAWPFLLDGRDFIGIAKTGSGKTLAFGVPAMMHVLNKRNGKSSRGRNPLCLVLSPTRELAEQIFNVLCNAGQACDVESVCLYGGTSKGPQISSLKSGVDIVIGTPGRLKDLMNMEVCQLNEVSFVVLDEADRMLDMGFEEDVRFILGKTCFARQMVMFSATWPAAVHRLAQEYMDPNPVKVVIGSEDLAANHDVMQIVEVLDDRARYERLIALLKKYHESQRNRVLVFVLYQAEADRIENMLKRSGWNVVSIHGRKAQNDRTKALSLFKKGSCPLMVATDVAARGLDIPDVEVVINYSFPLTTEDYVHRIGRTGRAGRKGVAHTFFTQQNKGLAGELVNVLKEAGQIVPPALLKFGTHVKKKESKLYGAHFKEIAADAPKAKKITFDDSDDEN